MPKIKPTKIFIAAVCALAIALTAWYFLKPKQEAPQFITAEVSRGDIESNQNGKRWCSGFRSS